MRTVLAMSAARFVVKKAKLFADGHCRWVDDPRRAFVFEDAIDGRGPLSDARAWADAHADHLRKTTPRRQRGLVHVAPAPEACFGAIEERAS